MGDATLLRVTLGVTWTQPMGVCVCIYIYIYILIGKTQRKSNWIIN